jgi:hypothetical protein
MEAVITESVSPETDDDRRVEWHQLWVSVRRWQWSSLAVVPASPTDWAVQVARSLTRVGSIHLGTAVQLLDASQMPKSAIRSFTSYLDDARAQARSVVVACSNPARNEASIPVILAADAVILAIVRDESTFKGTQQLLKLFGPRIIGSVLLPKSLTRPATV